MKVESGYTYSKGTAAGLSQTLNNFIAWNYFIQRFTGAHREAYNWISKEKLFFQYCLSQRIGPTKVKKALSLKNCKLSLELSKQQYVPMGIDEQQNTEQKQSIC